MTNEEMIRKENELTWNLNMQLAANHDSPKERDYILKEYRREVRELRAAARGPRTPELEAQARRQREASKAKKYGLTPDAFEAMVAGQGGRCAACRVPFGLLRDFRPCVDHDHATGAIRGILCMLCNTTLGHAHDNPEILRGLLRHLAGGTG